MNINTKELDKLLEDIRSCNDCKKTQNSTPFVYGTPSADILVVSKTPLQSAFDSNHGEQWIEGPFSKYQSGTPARVREW